jgi:hypothetical protein
MIYRYTLKREWLGNGGMLNWIMLNPSTADDVFNNPTIRKCIGFAKRWGFSSIEVTNLFAMRATDPKELRSVSPADAIGDCNDAFIWHTAKRAKAICVAWGDGGTLYGRDEDVLRALPIEPWCIRTTKAGNPAHPSREGYTLAALHFNKHLGDRGTMKRWEDIQARAFSMAMQSMFTEQSPDKPRKEYVQ